MGKGRQKQTHPGKTKGPQPASNSSTALHQQKLGFGEKTNENEGETDPPIITNDTSTIDRPPELDVLYSNAATAENLLDDDWDLHRLHHVVKVYEGVAGNELWEYWNKAEFADKLGWFCTNYADICINPPKPHTWEEVAVEMFEGVDHDVDAIDGVITSVLDYSKMCEQGAPNEQPEWETRAFLLGLADSDPLMVFGFH